MALSNVTLMLQYSMICTLLEQDSAFVELMIIYSMHKLSTATRLFSIPIKIPHQGETENWEEDDEIGTFKKTSQKRKTHSSISTRNKGSKTNASDKNDDKIKLPPKLPKNKDHIEDVNVVDLSSSQGPSNPAYDKVAMNHYRKLAIDKNLEESLAHLDYKEKLQQLVNEVFKFNDLVVDELREEMESFLNPFNNAYEAHQLCNQHAYDIAEIESSTKQGRTKLIQA
ncbi:hypothetical protein JHK85_012768 [Glycine max]|nr:hypothetical protein JHK85_012768 [Glycine max]